MITPEAFLTLPLGSPRVLGEPERGPDTCFLITESKPQMNWDFGPDNIRASLMLAHFQGLSSIEAASQIFQDGVEWYRTTDVHRIVNGSALFFIG